MKLISIETSLLTLCLLNLGQAYDLKALAEYYRPGSGNDTTTATTTTVAAVETTTQAPTASATTIVSTIPTTTAPIATTDAQPTTTTIRPPIYATPAPNPTTTEQIKPTTTSTNDYYQVPDVNISIPSIPAPSKPVQDDHSSNLEEMPVGVPSDDTKKPNVNQESSGNHKSSKHPNNSYRPPAQTYPQHRPKYQPTQPTQPNYNTHNNQGQQGSYYPTNAQTNPKFNMNQFKQGFEKFYSEFKQEYNDYQNNLNKQQQYSAPVYSNNNNGYTVSNGYNYNGNTNANGYNYNGNSNANVYGNSNNYYQQSNNWSYF